VSAYGRDLASIHDAGFGGFARAAAPGVLAILGARRRRVVELGCGSGVLTAALARAGRDVLGIDSSAAMLALARKRAPRARFVRASFVDAAIPPCDAVVAVGEVFNYLVDRRNGLRAIERLFRRAHAALFPGGVVVFDALVRDRSRPACREVVREGKDWAVVVRIALDRGGSRLVRRITTFRRLGTGAAWRRGTETIASAIFDARALGLALSRAGFRVAVRRGFGGAALGVGHVVFVARKR